MFGELGAPLEQRLSAFFEAYCPDKLCDTPVLAETYAAGKAVGEGGEARAEKEESTEE